MLVAERPVSFSISCIVPAFNEAAGIESVLQSLKQVLSGLSQRVEIVVVNDGSRDETFVRLCALARPLALTVIDFSRNFGKEAAMTAGIARARGDVVLIIDADLQEPLDTIERMVAKWREGYDMVYAVRNSREDESWLKRMGVSLFYYLMGQNKNIAVPPDARDFRLMDRRVVEALRLMPERNRFMKGLFSWVGFNSTALPIQVTPRASGRSSFNFRRLSELALTGITSFSNIPLRIWGAIGFAISLLAFLYVAYTVVRTLMFGADVPGFPTLATSIMFFAGIQLMSIGILGEYISRVFDEVKQRPHYLVAHELDFSPLRTTPGDAPRAG